MKQINKKIYYRVAQADEPNFSLQKLLEQALMKTNVEDRKQEINKYEKTFRLINRTQADTGILLCEVVMVDPGASQLLVVYGDQPNAFQISAISTEQLSKELLKAKSDFINATLFFAVKNNEVVIMPTLAITSRALEVYLNWLLKEKLELLPQSDSITLKKKIPQEYEEQVRQSPVRKIEITANIANTSTDEFTNTFYISPASLKGILPSLGKDLLPVDEISEDSNLRAKIVLTYNRKTDAFGQKTLNAIGTTLRSLPGEDFSLTLQNNTKIHGSDLELQKLIKLYKLESGMLPLTDILQEMRNWLIELNAARETA